MIHVRRYVASDEPEVLALAGAFHQEAPNFRDFDFDADKVRQLLENARASDDWLALVARDGDNRLAGFALVAVAEMYFGRDLELLDLAIYVRPTRRGWVTFRDLVDRIEEWGREKGAVRAQLGINTGISHDRALSSFMKLGYTPSGIAVTKPL